MLECPLYNPTSDKFPPLFANEVLAIGSLKTFFQLDHRVDISLYPWRLLYSAISQFDTIMMYS